MDQTAKPDKSTANTGELTDPTYWSGVWKATTLPKAVNPADSPTAREYCSFFASALEGRKGTILEIGCGCSPWLPFFASLGWEVAGLDYTRNGCEQARAILQRDGIPGMIYECDAFAPLPELLDRFDAVVSLGVIEHFTDTAATIRSFTRFLKPGGVMLTTCPNMAGYIGTAQKWLDRPVYERHVPLNTELLSAAHRAADLSVIKCEYLGSLNFHIVNCSQKAPAHQFAHKVLQRLTRIGWAMPFSTPRNMRMSSGVGCAATKGSRSKHGA